MKRRIGVLVSGRGTNLQALLDAQAEDYEVVLVLSNREGAPALERATRAGVPCATVVDGKNVAKQREMARRLRDSRVDLVVLAGFDRILAADFFAELRDVPVIATHPSLLPRFGGRGMIGLAVHEAVLRSGDAETGCTIFRVRPDRLDDGEVIVQRRVSVLPGDTSRTLEERVLHQEHRALVEAVRSFSR